MARFNVATTAGTAVARTAKTSTDSNQLVSVMETITVATGQMTLANAIGNIRVPAGAEIAFVQLSSTDIDSGTAVTLSIGDSGSTARLLAANTVGQAGGVVGPTIAIGGFGYRYATETLVQVYFAVAPTTPVAGTISYAVHYVSQ